MRQKIIMVVVLILLCVGIGYLLGTAALVIGLMAFGVGFFFGKRQGAH